MIYAVVMAGGAGSRMGGEVPKQYLDLAGLPVITYPIRTFSQCAEIDEILVLCPREWLGRTEELINEHVSLEAAPPIRVLPGGKTRDDTLTCALKYIEEQGFLLEDTIIVTHDAARPLVTRQIIEQNIAAAKKYGACNTVIPTTDTIVESADGKMISQVPDRRTTYQSQTPQTFRALKLKRLHDSLTAEEKAQLTDASKIFILRGEPVYLVKGEAANLKITYPRDMAAAEYFLRESSK